MISLEFYMTLRTSTGVTNIESSLHSACSLGISQEWKDITKEIFQIQSYPSLGKLLFEFLL